MSTSGVVRFAVVALACLGALLVPASVSADPYVALGDSVTAGVGGTGTYAGLLYTEFENDLGANEFLNRAQVGQSSGSIRGSQLTTALADINSPSDTKAVTVGVGGNDALSGACDSNYHLPACPFRANFGYILDQLQTALAADPGIEKFAVLAYYNPKNATVDEASFDNQLFGANNQVGLGDQGLDLGLNDIIYQEAATRNIPVADPSAEFKAQGQGLMSGDVIHPNGAGHEVIAQKFCDVLLLGCATPTATISKVSVSGPARVKKGKNAIYSVKITNSGKAAATDVRLKVSGRGVSFNKSVGTISASATKTVKLKLKLKTPGKIMVSFTATSDNAGGKTVKKTITVRK